MKIWTPDRITRAIELLRATPKDRLEDVCAQLSREWGFDVTRTALQFGVWRYGKTTVPRELGLDVAAEAIAAQDAGDTQRQPAMTFEQAERLLDVTEAAAGEGGGSAARFRTSSAAGHEDFSRLTRLAQKYAKRGGLTLEALCDELNLSPKQGRDLAERAIEAGYHVDVHGGVLDFRPASEPTEEVHVDTPHVSLGEEIVIAVASDMHHASKHHESDALKRHVEWAYESGAREFFNPGDTVAGGYRFLKYEITSNGIDAQCEEACRFFEWAGTEINWRMIAGNHCESFDVGIDAGAMIAQKLRANGQTNVHYYGPRAARLRLGPTRIAMHHPGGGLAYALSYKIQKYIDAMPLAERPHFLFTGHTHQKLWIERGGVNGFLCGTFENGDSSFGRMLGGEVQVGGWLIRYQHDEHGNVASVAAEFRKQPHRRMNYIQVPA